MELFTIFTLLSALVESAQDEGTPPNEFSSRLLAKGVPQRVISVFLDLAKSSPDHIWGDRVTHQLAIISTRRQTPIRPRALWGEFWEAGIGDVSSQSDPDSYLIRAEPWCPACLENGVGPWSYVRHGESQDYAWPDDDLKDRLPQYAEEHRLRITGPDARQGGVDGPPSDMELLGSVWIELANEQDFDTLQMTLWRQLLPLKG